MVCSQRDCSFMVVIQISPSTLGGIPTLSRAVPGSNDLPAPSLSPPLALGPYPSRLLQTARLQAFSPARGIPEGSPRHLSPMASGAWRTRRAPSASGRVRRSLLEQSSWSARTAGSRPARGFPSEASLPGWLQWVTVSGGCHDQGHS